MIDNPDIGAPAPAWKRLRFEATAAAADEPSLASYLNASILSHATLGEALSYHLAEKLSSPAMAPQLVRHVIIGIYDSTPDLIRIAEADMQAVLERDPAARGMLQPFLFFKGFLALQTHRVAHALWRQGRETLAHFQSRASELFDVDIHPAARIGEGVMLDASGITIGETAIVGEGCRCCTALRLAAQARKSATAIRRSARCPPPVGAKILGNITVGDEAKVAAGSVVLKDVPARCTVAGVPAKIVGGPVCCQPAETMDQGIPDQTTSS